MDEAFDDEMRENLKEFSTHISGVGRMIGSTKIDLDKLIAMKVCLALGTETLDTYIKILKMRYEEVG
jgi:archaellum component FlaC